MRESWRIAAGATYALNEVTGINVSWAMVWPGDKPVEETKFTSGIFELLVSSTLPGFKPSPAT